MAATSAAARSAGAAVALQTVLFAKTPSTQSGNVSAPTPVLVSPRARRVLDAAVFMAGRGDVDAVTAGIRDSSLSFEV